MSVINANPLMLGDAGYNIGRSLRFRSSASAYLSRTPASAGNRKTWTWSGWVKRGAFGSTQIIYKAGTAGVNGFNSLVLIYFVNGEVLRVSSNNDLYLVTTQVFRDPSAWYHVVLICDTTQATATNRLRLFVNGVEVTAFSTDGRATYISQNSDSAFNNTVLHEHGRNGTDAGYFDGYLAEVNFIDGQALTPSSFGQTDAVTGVWTPKKYTGTYGTNGFYLPFSDNTSATTLAYDKSGNGNNWTPNNISTTAGATYDSMTDVPTLTSATAANYCVINPFSWKTNSGTVSAGNLNVATPTGSGGNFATINFPTSGKWYYEQVATSGSNYFVMVSDSTLANAFTTYIAYFEDGQKWVNGVNSSYGAAYTFNDVIGVAVNCDANEITFYKNGVSQGAISYSLNNGNFAAFATDGSSGVSASYSFNFGQRPFSYTPPTGFKALNTFNLPDPTIKKPNQYMDVVTNTGTGTSRFDPTNFAPDLVWTKSRSASGFNIVQDSVRGAGNRLITDGTYAELFDSTYGSFASNGFTFGSNSNVNTSGVSYVDWFWKKGATPGFDIVTYTGNYNGSTGTQTIAHNLGVAPKMIIIKNRSSAYDWAVGHASIGWSQAGNLNLTNSFGASSYFNSTAPTASVFSVGLSNISNQNSSTHVAYLFAEIAGFSKFGSYTGTGYAEGPFVYCGFRPKFIMIKNATRSTSYTSWQMIDTSREPYNIGSGTVPSLWANNSNVEGTRGASGSGTDTINYMDVLSNGFKIRSAASDETNDNTQTFIYAAFAENPFKYSNAR